MYFRSAFANASRRLGRKIHITKQWRSVGMCLEGANFGGSRTMISYSCHINILQQSSHAANTYSSRTRSEFLLICRCLMHERRHILRSECPPSKTISARLKAQRKWKRVVKHKIPIIQRLQIFVIKSCTISNVHCILNMKFLFCSWQHQSYTMWNVIWMA